jgi:hypothetical protein
MKTHRLFAAVAATIAAAAILAAAAQTPAVSPGQGPAFLKGIVRDLSKPGTALTASFEAARAEALKTGWKGPFFASYLFTARHKVRYGRIGAADGTYDVTAGETKIRIREKDRDSLEVSTGSEGADAPAPAGMLLLCDPRAGLLIDVSILDPDRTYEFKQPPVYWLGNFGPDESLAFIVNLFDKGRDVHLRESLLFLAASHPGPKAYDFLKKSALGAPETEVRKTAVFWIGESGEDRSLADLKEILSRTKERDLKEHIVFAVSLSRKKEGVTELIRIAKEDPDREVREKAVFWLGQKASEESVKALKDIVDRPDKDGLKEQAVFAISQLPKDKSVPMLIDIAKTNKDPGVRKKAIFWLGQTGDPAALKFFEEILLKK